MARPVRVEFAGAAYHVMARGHERKSVFRDDEDRRGFLDVVAEIVERFGVRVQTHTISYPRQEWTDWPPVPLYFTCSHAW